MTTTELSTSIPTPMASPDSENMLRVMPLKYISTIANTTLTGIDTATMTVGLMSRKNSSRMIIADHEESHAFGSIWIFKDFLSSISGLLFEFGDLFAGFFLLLLSYESSCLSLLLFFLTGLKNYFELVCNSVTLLIFRGLYGFLVNLLFLSEQCHFGKHPP